MVPDALLQDDLDGAPERLVAFFQYRGVFRHRDHLVRSATDMQQRDSGLGQGFEIINRVALIGFRLLFTQAVGLEAGGPGSPGFSPVLFLAVEVARPASEVADRSISIDAGYLFRIGPRPIVDDEAAAAHALEGDLAGEAVLSGQVAVEEIPAFDGRRVAEQSAHLDIGDVKALLQQGDVRLGLMAEKASPPDPGLTLGGGPGLDEDASVAIELELVFFESAEAPARLFERAGDGLPSGLALRFFPGLE